MSEQDQIKPYHAKEAAPGQEAADVVAEVLKHAAEREKAGKSKPKVKGPPKWMLPLSVNLGVLALYFLIAQPDFLVVSPNLDRRSVEERVQATTGAMAFTVARVDAFFANEGRLPTTLAEVNDPNTVFTYTVVGDSTYLLTTVVDGQSIVYDSADPEGFAAGLADRITG
jgi:hypothetical protein